MTNVSKNIPSNRIFRARQSGSIYTDNSEDEIYQSAVETLRHLQGICSGVYHEGDVVVEIGVNGSTKADLDNIAKGILDALQGILFRNDRQVKGLLCFCENYTAEEIINITKEK